MWGFLKRKKKCKPYYVEYDKVFKDVKKYYSEKRVSIEQEIVSSIERSRKLADYDEKLCKPGELEILISKKEANRNYSRDILEKRETVIAIITAINMAEVINKEYGIDEYRRIKRIADADYPIFEGVPKQFKDE